MFDVMVHFIDAVLLAGKVFATKDVTDASIVLMNRLSIYQNNRGIVNGIRWVGHVLHGDSAIRDKLNDMIDKVNEVTGESHPYITGQKPEGFPDLKS